MDWTIKRHPHSRHTVSRRQEIITGLYHDRRLTTPAAIKSFNAPAPPLTITPDQVGINQSQLTKTISRLQTAINQRQPILIYGDYDADGITATAILWETLHHLGARVHPFIPDREAHGYGLSVQGIRDALQTISSIPLPLSTKGEPLSSPPFEKGGVGGVDSTPPPPTSHHPHPLIITVDNGITAFAAAQFLGDRNIDLIITDHHQPGDDLPQHYSLVHTDQLAGCGIAWILAKELALNRPHTSPLTAPPAELARGGVRRGGSVDSIVKKSLDLVTIGTVADMLPLLGVNRQIVKHGLIALQQSTRPGIKALLATAAIDANQELSTYHINFLIAPRLNAMGRLSHALDSLRLLCTTNLNRATQLAQTLNQTNQERQELTQTLTDQALSQAQNNQDHIIIIDHEDYHEGVIGLVAGKLAEIYHKPAIVISRRESVSKASARSIAGVNIIDLIRAHEHLLVNAGGHPMAAGFSLKTDIISQFTQQLTHHANIHIDPQLLQSRLNIDCLIELSDLNDDLYYSLDQFKPFGIGNPQPVFASTQAKLISAQPVGNSRQHLKCRLTNSHCQFSAIGFNLAAQLPALLTSPLVDIAYTLEENVWNGRRELQLKLKDIKPSL